MDEGIVAADASPLITLASVGAFDLLRELFGRITVTTAVRDEVLSGENQPGTHELNTALEQGWAVIAEVPPMDAAPTGLGAGEASVLAFAQNYGGPTLLLIDDQLARSHARELGNPVTGVLGILLMAKRQRLIPAVGPLLGRMAARGFRMSDRVLRDVLAEAGESPLGVESLPDERPEGR